MTVRNAEIVGFIVGFLLGSSPRFAGLGNVMAVATTIIGVVLFVLNRNMKGEFGGFLGGLFLGVAFGGLFQAAPVSIHPQ